ncbi:MAG: adenylate/guanylate cyclase domain-containing protein [Deltaproteobacteria bacterium]|nr:adenylate/guanylate cyclase domain-containing protein [Deltaproteobacteria bacterium]
MGADEARTLRLLALHNQIIQQAATTHNGVVIKTVGDAFLVDFPSVVNAVQCAQQVHAQFHAHNVGKENAEQIHVRIGIHLGDIVQQNGDVFGDGVNVASRLQGLAEPDTICISQKVYEEVEKKLPLGAVISLGRPQLKNIVQRQAVYLLLSAPPKGLPQRLQVQRLKLSRRMRPIPRAVAVGLLLILGTLITARYFPSLLLSPQHSVLVTQEAQPPLPLPDKPSIVILPFVNMSEDPKQDYFSDGLTEDLTTDLSKISNLFVIARNSAFTYKGKAMKVEEVGRELGVRYVLEGSVRKVNDKVRITTQLVDASTGYHLWSERYDRDLKDIFALQDEIRQKIVTALKVNLTKEEQERLKRAPTGNLEAYDYYLHGVDYYWRFTKETNVQARQMFEKAIELDPQYAAAYALLGLTYNAEWSLLWSQNPQTLEQAFALVQKAITLDDSLPVAHRVLGWVYAWKKQHESAIAEGEHAIALDPNEADGYWQLAQILNVSGKPETAIELVEKAMRLNPHAPANYFASLGWAYAVTGRYEEAIGPLKRSLALNPNFLVPRLALASVYSELDQEREARAETAEVLRLDPNFSLEALRQRVPDKDSVRIERLFAALRKAGLK